jgi:hypothetical protein
MTEKNLRDNMARTTDKLLKVLAPGGCRSDMTRIKGYFDNALIYLASGHTEAARREMQYLHQFSTCVDGIEFRSPYADNDGEDQQ